MNKVLLLKACNGGCSTKKIAKTQNKSFKITFVIENVFVYIESFDSFYLDL